jgi:hypothetical protein
MWIGLALLAFFALLGLAALTGIGAHDSRDPQFHL